MVKYEHLWGKIAEILLVLMWRCIFKERKGYSCVNFHNKFKKWNKEGQWKYKRLSVSSFLKAWCFLIVSCSTSRGVQENQGAHLHGGVSKRIPQAFPCPPHHTIVVLSLVLPSAVVLSIQVGCMTPAVKRSTSKVHHFQISVQKHKLCHNNVRGKINHSYRLNHQPALFSWAQLPWRNLSLSCQLQSSYHNMHIIAL